MTTTNVPNITNAAKHYGFDAYVNKRRWASYWHQLNEIFLASPQSVLEVGVGAGVIGAVLRQFGVEYQSLDLDAALKPHHVAPVTAMPFDDGQFDVVACFQVLEHIPYESFAAALKELRRVASRVVIISLPGARAMWSLQFGVPRVCAVSLFARMPRLRARKHKPGGEHFWEISKRGYPLKRILQDLADSELTVEKTYRSPDSPRHRFFVATPSLKGPTS
jgi:ubiquinone/menaquinone biosynthesis C-methylase UbiE